MQGQEKDWLKINTIHFNIKHGFENNLKDGLNDRYLVDLNGEYETKQVGLRALGCMEAIEIIQPYGATYGSLLVLQHGFMSRTVAVQHGCDIYPLSGLQGRKPTPSLPHTSVSSNSDSRQSRLYWFWKKENSCGVKIIDSFASGYPMA